jgi:molybdenum cofactor cytidylyltransferase
MVAGIVLAAGMATRMGRCKQLLPLGGKKIIQRVVEQVIGQVGEVYVVIGHRGEEVAAELSDYPVTCVDNPDYRSGMLSSVQCGVRAAGKAVGFLLCLGDQPGIGSKVVSVVLAEAEGGDKGLVIPTNRGKRGHPIWIHRRYREEILALGRERGLNVVTRGHPDDTLEIPVDDQQILVDLDTPADYQREKERFGIED